jgi:hypothetical protein
VLLTTPRCGASLLITALNQNPAIACTGQRLATYGEVPDHIPARSALPIFWDANWWKGTAAVGFHARLYHLDNDDWNYLLRQDVCFILLSRTDLMGQLVSDYIVNRLGGPRMVPSWTGIEPAHPGLFRYPQDGWGQVRDVPPFRLPPSVVRRNGPTVQSLYRSDVQTQRQAQRPWIEQITNWDEILEDARGTSLYHTLSHNPIDRLLRRAVVSRAADPIPGNEVLIA